MSVQNAHELRAVISKSGLLEETVVEGLFAAGAPTSSTEAAETLVKKGLLTPFQARMLLSGRHRGLLLGSYKVLDQLGRGGMGVVYLAEHTKLHRRVALKILPKKSVKDPLALERFYREARAVAAVDHPNIVKAYDVCEEDGFHFIVMEYVPGVNLQNQLDLKGPLPWKIAAGFIAQACRGLQHVHERGLVHRDIKPGNLLVDRSGTVKILDLGLARCFQNVEDNVTAKFAQNEELTGSIDFMAPECARGEKDIDIRSDIYSLGLTLYALVLGKSPYEGTPAQKLLSHQVKPLPPLHETHPSVPPELSAIVARMTQKQPEDRYPHPTAVLDALAPWAPAAPAPPSTIRMSAGKTAIQPAPNGTKPEVLPQALPEDEPPRTNGAVSRTRLAAPKVQVTASAEVADEEPEDRAPRAKHGRKRFKAKREAEKKRKLIAIIVGVAAAVILLPLMVMGGVYLFGSSPETTTIAAANTTPTPGAPNNPPPRSPNPAPGAGRGAQDNIAAGNPAGNPRPPAPPASPPDGSGISDPKPGGGAGKNSAANPPPGVKEGFEVGNLAPEIDGIDLDDQCFLLSDYRGSVVLLDFWGFW